MNSEHTLSIMVRNKPGVLTKIAGMFYRRDYNIQTLTVGKMHTAGLSKILISVPVDDRDIELLRRQIENLVDVKWAHLMDRNQSIMMEVCLIRFAYDTPDERRQIMASAQPYQPRIRRIGDRSITLEIAESPEIVDDFVEIMNQYKVFDMSRTGMTCLGPDLPPIKRETRAEPADDV
ncbi:MAG: acetolactate synthase small subunit [Proteobacteria bacterium]|nr:acetolactate synthase small subunit [Pseudomonadota bacterium]